MSQFRVDERVLAWHGPLIYDAKVTKVEDFQEPYRTTGKTGFHYFVHYKGWKTTWDEWVSPDRLLKNTEETRLKQKELQKQHREQTAGSFKSKASGSKDKKASVSITLSRGTKRAREEDDISKKPEMRLDVPELLKSFLVDDWESVTKCSQLVHLPRDPHVDQILAEFQTHCVDTKPDSLRDPESLAPTVVSGLRTYFDKSLGSRLLYRFERAQYANIRYRYITGHHVVAGESVEMSTIFGAEHLLRMLVMLPEIIAHTSLDAESVGLIRDYTNELLKWMSQHKERLFMSEYENSANQYQMQMAKG